MSEAKAAHYSDNPNSGLGLVLIIILGAGFVLFLNMNGKVKDLRSDLDKLKNAEPILATHSHKRTTSVKRAKKGLRLEVDSLKTLLKYREIECTDKLRELATKEEPCKTRMQIDLGGSLREGNLRPRKRDDYQMKEF